MIVGTAGHIDHGKTTLVRALTGVDTDRLPEEKARGISIELGYAFLEVPGAPAATRIGFVDVPGHERLVHTMLAGATGIDFGLLLIAADDGVMPQTREHLAVLSLLGLQRGAVVITKADRADESRIEQLRADAKALLTETSLADAGVLVVSARTGEGIAPLRDLLFSAARETPPRGSDGAGFRLALDRVFTLGGVGTVVTGTVHAGSVKVGDELALVPSPGGLRARVRSLHAQNQAVDEAHGGERCAIGLAGVAKDQIERGQWMTDPGIALSTDRLDAAMTLWHDEPKALRSGTHVRVHIGSKEVAASVAVLQVEGSAADSMAPGKTGLVQLVLKEAIGAWRGDRVVLRDVSASRTLAGGTVLDPFGPPRYRRSAQRAAELAAWSGPDAASRLRMLIDAAPFGVSLDRWSRSEGLREAARASSTHEALTAHDNVHGLMALARSREAEVANAAVAALQAFHEREPEMLGPDSARLRRVASPRLPEPLWRAVLSGLQATGRIAVRGAFVHLPEHGLRLSATDERLTQKLTPVLAAAGFEGRWARDLARDLRESEPLLRTTLSRLAQRGELHQVVKDLYFAPQTIAELAGIVRTIAQDGGGAVTAGHFRDATGLGRKRAIQLLEYFDRIGMLRRVGDEHRLRQDTALFVQATP